MDILTSTFLAYPLAGGMTFAGLAIAINIIAIRFIFQYSKETREEYVRKLTQAVIELEYQKTENLRLELELEKMKFMAMFKATTDQ